ncbi:hypothetical protein [Pontibacter sp. H249]|uniref:hypothetical protein n=1 Tax=Pontibacter sp. H249 TaxID=3133420 RepID=UPI0030C2D8FA
MKLTFTNLLYFLLLPVLASCNKSEEATPVPKPVTKTVVFEVFGDQDFSYSRYGDEQVSISLLIRRQDKETLAETIVFDSTFSTALKHIPVRANRLQVKKTIPDVQDNKEIVHIGVGYNLMQTSFGKSINLPADQVEKKVQLTVY